MGEIGIFRFMAAPTIVDPGNVMWIGGGWTEYPFDCYGHGYPNKQAFGPAGSDFTVPGVDQYCTLVNIALLGGPLGTDPLFPAYGPGTVFVDYGPQNWPSGAGISATNSAGLPTSGWLIDQGGPVNLIFNDNNYPDNHGTISVYLNIWPPQ